MSHAVLLVEPDVDALGELAEGLRARGMDVILADSIETALTRLQMTKVTAILIAESLVTNPNVEAALSANPQIAKLPRWMLVKRTYATDDNSGCLPMHDPEAIARRLFALPTRPSAVSAERGDVRGDLTQVSVPDLLQLLCMNRRTGTLTLITPTGQGELRLSEGEIVDAAFRRVDGTKALYRLLAETEGTFSFVGGTTHQARRLTEPTNLLLLDGVRHSDEVRHILAALDAEHDALQSLPQKPAEEPALTELERLVLLAFEVPKTPVDVLDDLTHPDLVILQAVQHLLDIGLLRRIPEGALRVELAESETLGVLAAMARQLRRPGYQGNPRLVLFSTPPRLAGCLHALSRIADALPNTDNIPTAPVAHRLSTLRLSDGQELDIVGLPSTLAYSPLWNLTLLGSSAVVTLGNESTPALEEATSLASVPLLDAETLLGQIDESDPRQIAALVRATLEAAASR